MCGDLTPKVGQSPQAYLPGAMADTMTPLKRHRHTVSPCGWLSAGFKSATCCRPWGQSFSQEPRLCSLTLLHLHTPGVAPVLPAPLCSAICSHHIGIITWGREGLAFCEVGEMGRCWNWFTIQQLCRDVRSDLYPGLGSLAIRQGGMVGTPTSFG